VFGLTLAIDFKMNFSPDNPEGIDALHERTAKRLHNLCVTNNGMYIKLAQSVRLSVNQLERRNRKLSLWFDSHSWRFKLLSYRNPIGKLSQTSSMQHRQ